MIYETYCHSTSCGVTVSGTDYETWSPFYRFDDESAVQWRRNPHDPSENQLLYRSESTCCHPQVKISVYGSASSFWAVILSVVIVGVL